MRFIGLVLALLGIAVSYFLGIKKMSIDEARTRLSQILKLPGLAPPAPAQLNHMATLPAGAIAQQSTTAAQSAAARAAAAAHGLVP